MATNNAINSANPVGVASGGTGLSTTTAYAVVCAGTTSTGAMQNVSGVGSSGQVLTSNGASALPTWQSASASGNWVLISTQTASSSASLSFTSSQVTGYTQYAVVFVNITNAGTTTTLNMDWSTNNGSTYLGSAFQSGIVYNSYNSNTLTNVNSTSTCPLTPSLANASAKLNGILFLAFPSSAISCYSGQLYLNDTTSLYANAYGVNTGTTTINNIKFSYSSGNITSGTISLYGITT